MGATALYALGATPIALMVAGVVYLHRPHLCRDGLDLPRTGGSAAYSRHAFNDLVSFIAGWGLLFAEPIAEAALQRAEAVARELHLAPDLKLIRARSVEAALLRLVERGNTT